MKSSGAVSPVTRAIASNSAVMIAGIAVGSTIRTVARKFDIPSASAPSRTTCGTVRIACSDVRTSSGSISIMNANDAENAGEVLERRD